MVVLSIPRIVDVSIDDLRPFADSLAPTGWYLVRWKGSLQVLAGEPTVDKLGDVIASSHGAPAPLERTLAPASKLTAGERHAWRVAYGSCFDRLAPDDDDEHTLGGFTANGAALVAARKASRGVVELRRLADVEDLLDYPEVLA